MENLLPQNIGSNEFQQELENFAFHNLDQGNMQQLVDLVKALSLYEIKNEELVKMIYGVIEEQVEDLTLTQI